jgi:hypothetical protein
MSADGGPGRALAVCLQSATFDVVLVEGVAGR